LFKARRKPIVIAVAAAVVLLAGALAVTLLTGNSSGSNETVNGNTVAYQAGHRPAAPEFTATTLTGKTIRLSSYRGKVVVLNFWGSWCPPCRREAPTLAVLSEQYGKQGVAFIGDDVRDSPVNALAFTRNVGIAYPSINDSSGSVVQAFGMVTPVDDTPTTVVIDKTGHVADLVLGEAGYGDLAKLLQKAAT
jgi:peroxiredoxin